MYVHVRNVYFTVICIHLWHGLPPKGRREGELAPVSLAHELSSGVKTSCQVQHVDCVTLHHYRFTYIESKCT